MLRMYMKKNPAVKLFCFNIFIYNEVQQSVTMKRQPINIIHTIRKTTELWIVCTLIIHKTVRNLSRSETTLTISTSLHNVMMMYK